jgi:3-hydroxybutyryl-CoA dehydrogenase
MTVPLDVRRGDLTVAIVGCGTMGRGIAQVVACAGCRVLLADSSDGAAAEAKAAIAATLDMLSSRGKLSKEAAADAAGRLREAAGLSELKDSDIVIEAILETLDAKRALMRALEAIVGDGCILATNTSSLSVTAIAAACRLPGRVAGYHFFNPVPLMKVVEVIDGALTEPWVGDRLVEFAERIGHTPVRAQDMPGFIVNHAGRGYGTEALRLLSEDVADVPILDAILKEAAGFRMGPFELLDLTGLDVSHPVMETIYRQFYDEPRFRPSPIARRRVEAGLYGRKSGRGFYEYCAGAKQGLSVPVDGGFPPRSCFIAEGHARDEISRIVVAANVQLEDAAEAELCIVPLLGEDATTAALRLNLEPARTLGIDAVFGLPSHRTLVATPATSAEARRAAQALFTADGMRASTVRDSPGAVVQRVLATIVNVACDIAQQRIASPGDIDLAVRLGLGYPKGPLAWGDEIGPSRILAILESIAGITRDPRYRPSLWLRRRALLGISLLHDEI